VSHRSLQGCEAHVATHIQGGAPMMSPPLFSLFNHEKHVVHEKIRRVLFVNFITFSVYSFNCIKFDLFIFKFHHLAFNFHIKFVLIF